MARMVMVLTGVLGHAPVAVTVLVEVAGHVAGMIVVLTGHFPLTVLIAMAVRIEIAGRGTRMVMVLTRFSCDIGFPPKVSEIR